MQANLFYDTDPAFAAPMLLEGDISVSREAVGNFSYMIDATLAEGDSLYFRVYPWLGGGNASTGRYLFLQDVTISGTGTMGDPPAAEGVYWSLTEADTTSVTSASDNLGGAPVRGTGIMIRNYADDSDPGPGPLGAIQRWWLDANWPDEMEPNPERYIEFAAAADAGYAFDADSISLYLGSHGTGNMMASLYYSTDPAFSDSVVLEEHLDVPRTEFGYFVYELDVAVEEGDSLYFRVYPYLEGGSTSAGKYVLLQAVTLAGSVVAPPPAVEGVYWSLTEADTTSVTATGDNLGGAPVRSAGIMIRNYADDSDPGPGPLGAIQRWWLDANWPDEMEPNPERYIEFAAAADAGDAFDADSIALYLGSHGTDNMMASLYYDTDPDFSDAVVLEANLDIPRSQLGHFSYDLDVAVEEGDSLYFRVYPYLDGGSTSAGKYVLLQAVTLAGSAIDPTTIATESVPDLPSFVLHPSFPNPIRTVATVRYEMAEAAEVQIELFNVLGQRLRTLAEGIRVPGSYAISVDASELASGVYFLRMRSGEQALTQQVVVAH